jgi:hypothetical protein
LPAEPVIIYQSEKWAWWRRFEAVTQIEWQLHLLRSLESGLMSKTVLAI